MLVIAEDVDHTFQTNTFGAMQVTQAFLSYLRKSAAARVVNVSSGSAERLTTLLPVAVN